MDAPHLIWSLPFLLILLQIALWPIFAQKWWEKNYPLLVLPLGGIVAIYYLLYRGDTSAVYHTAHEYFSFIALIGSLFVVSGGIHLRLKGRYTPTQNVILLGSGAVIANIVGTTGASMILIRPFIRGNGWRFEKFHLVFFIFIVSNCGGALTPIGDPPLFLGYLKGVPFFWVFKELWYKWLIAIGFLLMIFYFIDKNRFEHQRERLQKEAQEPDDLRIEGLYNVFFLVIIVAATFVNDPPFVREAIMIAAAAASYYFTPSRIHGANVFNFHPITEVAILFAAIFAAMIPALDWLSANAGQIGIETPKQFYWSTGLLSAVLDNAPTYLNFLAAGMGFNHLSINHPADVLTFANEHAAILQAISAAAVFFGAMTYIGNGPNFMCKAIAEHAKMPAPTFLEYIWKYSLPLLMPVLIVVYFLIR